MKLVKMNKYSESLRKSAEYDIKTAESMFETGRYIYVIFMCHLSIEKMLKAIVAEVTKQIPPKTHNLLYLAKLIDLELPQDIFDFVSKINNVSIATRYPEDFSELLKVYTKLVAKEYLEKTKKVIKCLLADERLKT
jgi:HEPN domain-containing protein